MNSPQQSPLKWRSASLLSVVALSIQLIAPVFAVAKDKVWNLLSKGIVNED